MTTAAMFLETVSLNDDAPSSGGRVTSSSNSNSDVDGLEAQRFPSMKKASNSNHDPLADSHADDVSSSSGSDGDAVVVVVDTPPPVKYQQNQNQQAPRVMTNGRPLLPPLRVPPPPSRDDDAEDYMRDYVDPTLFSPEVSRRAVEIARGRAKTLEMELKELALLEDEKVAPPQSGAKLSPAEAVGIISSAFLASLSRVKQLVTSGEKEYDLLSGSSPSSKMDDLDTDGDGLQISPDGSKGAGKHFQPTHRSALKRVSAYSSLDKDKKSGVLSQQQQQQHAQQRPKKRIVWHEEVLDQDEEFYEDEEEELVAGAVPSPLSSPGETESLMEVSGPQSILHYKNDRLTPRSKKKRKKLVKGMMRRLTPSEKEELYRQRPDLMIIPNWAQKYRQGLEDEESSRWSFWLLSIIGTLAVLLIVLIILIARERAAAA